MAAAAMGDWESIRALTEQQRNGHGEDEVPTVDPDDEPDNEPPEQDDEQHSTLAAAGWSVCGAPFRPLTPPPPLVHSGNVINYSFVPCHPDRPPPPHGPERRVRSPRPRPYDQPWTLADAYRVAGAAQPPPQTREQFNAELDAVEQHRIESVAQTAAQHSGANEDGASDNEAAEAANVLKTDVDAFKPFYTLEPDT
jgi:hypothetical protein